MKTLQDIKKDFLREASEYDTGKKEEDFHAYLRQHNLEHHLSDTQKQDRQMASNGLNAMGMVAGIAIPLTLGAIFGYQRLTNNNIMGHGGYDNFNYEEASQILGLPRQGAYNARMIDNSNSLSGLNTREMPMADSHIGQEVNNYFNNELMPLFKEKLAFKEGNYPKYYSQGTNEFIDIPVLQKQNRAVKSQLTPPQSLL